MRISDWSSDVCSSDLHFLPLGVARVDQEQPHARIEERQLAIAVLQLFEIELGDLEGGGTGKERHLRAALVVCRADHLQRRFGVAPADRKSVVSGTSVSVSVDLGGRRIIKKNN